MIEYYKEKPEYRVYWVIDPDNISYGKMEITVDKETIYNVWDVEHIPERVWYFFARENPFWGEFFKERREAAAKPAKKKVRP